MIVLADGYWSALKGAKALAPEWRYGAHAHLTGEDVRRTLHDGLAERGAIARETGSIERAFATGIRTLEAIYEVPFLAHAAIEPPNATAHVRPDGVEIWAPTQMQGVLQREVASMLGLTPEQIQVHTTFLGGTFGRALEIDFVLQAVAAAKSAGRPVKLIWSREEDLRHDYYRPAVVSRLRAALGADGMPTAWEHRIVAPSISSRWALSSVRDGIDPLAVEGAVDLPYALGAQRVNYVMKNTPVPVGNWRSVGHGHNAYFVECFIDEIARTAGKDPLRFRQALLASRPRHLAVLEKAAAGAGWDDFRASGRYLGLALHECYGSIVAQAVELSTEGGKPVRIERVTCAIDCGVIVHPDAVVAQIEGGIAMGLSEALHGGIRIEGGSVTAELRCLSGARPCRDAESPRPPDRERRQDWRSGRSGRAAHRSRVGQRDLHGHRSPGPETADPVWLSLSGRGQMRAQRIRCRYWRLVGSLALFGLVLSAPSREATGADAEKGYQYILTKPYDAPSMTEAMLWDVWGVWPEPARTEAEHASPAERRRMIFSRYGLVEEQGRDLPVSFVRTPGGGLTENCLMCHAGKVAGKYIYGLGNSSFTGDALASDVALIDAAGKPAGGAGDLCLAGRLSCTAINQCSRGQQCVWHCSNSYDDAGQRPQPPGRSAVPSAASKPAYTE